MNKAQVAATLSTKLLLLSPNVHALPALPYISKDVAPGECTLVHGPLWPYKLVVAYTNPRDGSTVAFRIEPHERIEELTSTIHTLKQGAIRVATNLADLGFSEWSPVNRSWIETHVSVKRGEVLPLLYSVGEGCYAAWVKGATCSVCPGDVGRSKVDAEPRIEWWAKVRNHKGQIGWIRMDKAPEIAGLDKCGDDLPEWAK